MRADPTMASTTDGVHLRVKHKTFTFQGSVEWRLGLEGVDHILGRPGVPVSSPPEFRGPDGRWAPVHLFVTSVNLCKMLTFLSLAEHNELPLVSYVSEAEGTLEFVDDGYRFTRIVLRPRIGVRAVPAIDSARTILEDAHRSCLISNSVRAEVVVEPTIGAQSGG